MNDVFKQMGLEQPAFPTWRSPKDIKEGMTLRDYFAAQVLSEITRIELFVEHESSEKRIATVCNICYRIADEMLKAREKTNG